MQKKIAGNIWMTKKARLRPLFLINFFLFIFFIFFINFFSSSHKQFDCFSYGVKVKSGDATV